CSTQLYDHHYLSSFLHPPQYTLFPTRRSSDLRLAPERGLTHVRPGDTPREHQQIARQRQLLQLPQLFQTRHVRPTRRVWKSWGRDRKSTRLNSSHEWISYAVFCLNKNKYENDY